jgi:lysophospholipase L1-like esterase
MDFNRRSFLKKAAAGTFIASGIPAVVDAAIPAGKKKKKGVSLITQNDVVLFQGDSITDAGRDRSINSPNAHQALGDGYVFLLAARLLYEFPKYNLSIYNRGISGNKVYQLSDRWEPDCLLIRPNLLSVLVGVNDFWHTLTHNYTGTVDIYENDLRGLLWNTKNLMPGVKLVIGEPFAMTGCSAVDDSWYPEFDKYRAAARRIAHELDAVFIPYQDVFNKALELAPARYWTHDGVHPSVAGCQLMAEAWLKAVV